MFVAKFCEIIFIGLKVKVKNIRNNVASVTLFYMIVNFKVTMRKYLPLYNLKCSFNINLKHSSSVQYLWVCFCMCLSDETVLFCIYTMFV